MVSKSEIANNPFLQLIIIAALCLVSVVLFSVIAILITVLSGEVGLYNISNFNDPSIIGELKFFQLMSAIGLFVVPPIVYGIIVSKNPIKILGLKKGLTPINIVLIIFFMLASIPILSWVVEFNAGMVLPDFLNGVEQWMKNSEANAAELTKAFLTFDGLGSLIYIMIIVAIVPAIGEELLFRGVLQKIFIQWTKNAHLGIWITAILFSALHMQFYGFFPRMLLGVIFGYLFYWSNSLWLPILGHFINNGSVVIASYFYPESIENAEVSFFEDSEYKIMYYLISLLASAMIFYWIKKANGSKRLDLPEKNAEIIS